MNGIRRLIKSVPTKEMIFFAVGVLCVIVFLVPGRRYLSLAGLSTLVTIISALLWPRVEIILRKMETLIPVQLLRDHWFRLIWVFGGFVLLASVLTIPDLSVRLMALGILVGVAYFHSRLLGKWPRLSLVVALGVLAMNAITIFHYSPPLPFADDYTSFVTVFSNLRAGMVGETLRHMFGSQFMEHTLAGSYLLVACAYLFSGTFELLPLLVLGLITFGFFGWLLWVWAERCGVLPRDRRFIWLSAMLLIGALSTFQVFNWPTNFGAVFLFHSLVLGSILLLTDQKSGRWQFPLSIVCAVLATYTFGSGFILWFLGLGFLLLQRSWTKAIAWLLFSTAILHTFFQNFQNPFAVQISLSAMAAFFFRFFGLITSFGHYAVADHVPSFMAYFLVLAAGIFIMGSLFVLVIRAALRRSWAFALYGAFLGLAGILAARQRAPMGPQQVFQSRYHLYSALAVWVVVVGLYVFSSRLKRSPGKLVSVGLMASLVLNLGAFSTGFSASRRHFENTIFGFYSSLYWKLPSIRDLNTTETPDDIYFASLFPARDAIRKLVFAPPVKVIQRAFADQAIPAGETSASGKQEMRNVSWRTHCDSVFFLAEIDDQAKEIKSAQSVNVCDGVQCWMLRRLNEHRFSWNLARHYFSSPENWVVFIPRGVVDTLRPTAEWKVVVDGTLARLIGPSAIECRDLNSMSAGY